MVADSELPMAPEAIGLLPIVVGKLQPIEARHFETCRPFDITIA